MATKTSKAAKTAKNAKTAKKTKPVKSAKPVRAAAKKTAAPQVVKVRHVRVNPVAERRIPRAMRVIPQYSYMKAPGAEHVFEVGDTVEVFCDH
ncbi:MAG: hypothetical protein AB1750_20910, partial [Chloroflexota bacterium]